MITHPSFRSRIAALALTLAIASPLATATEAPGHKSEAPAKPYPLSTCVVSGDKLEDGDMGPPVDYIHKEEGQPDRLVRLCCKGCVRDFKKHPKKYLKMIDDAAANGEKTDGHSDHHKHG